MGVWDRANLNQPEVRPPERRSSWAWREPERAARRVEAPVPGPPSAKHREEESDGATPLAQRKPVPKMPKARQDGRVRSPIITVAGTLLIVGLTVLAFAGGRLFGRVAEPTPEAQPQVAVVASTPEATEQAVTVAEAPTEPVEVTPIPLPSNFSRAPIVCLDPGHGGADRGFQRFFDDGAVAMEEATLNLEQSWDLEARLLNRGYKVVMTRESDSAVNVDGKDVNGDGRTAAHDPPRSDRNKNLDEIQARINVCNKANADLLISMHINGFSTGTPRGYEAWFTRERPFGNRSAEFATLAYTSLKDQLATIGYVLPPEEERGVLPDSTADVQKEYTVFQHFIITGPAIPGVVVPSKMPGAIIEALFVSNEGDAAVLASPQGREVIVNAYEEAIVAYFAEFPPGT